MALEIEGKVVRKLPIVTGEGRNGTWQKQEFVIETAGEYPKTICFTVFGDKTDISNTLKKDENVKVHFNVESREYNDRWYTNLQAWKIDRNETQAPPPPPPAKEAQGNDNDLPF